jgi:hypothetical protein
MADAVASRDRTLMINGLVSAFQMGVRDEMKEKTRSIGHEPFCAVDALMGNAVHGLTIAAMDWTEPA